MSDASTRTAELRAGIGAGVSRRWRGYFYVLAAATLFGFGGAFARFLFYNGVMPEQLTQVRLLTATAGLFVVLGVRCWVLGLREPATGSRTPIPQHLTPITHPVVVLLGVSLLFVMYTYYVAIDLVGVAPAILLQNTRPVLVMFYALVVLHERAPRFAPIATALAFVGCALVVRAYDPSLLRLDLAGVVAGLASAAFAAINLLAGRTVQKRIGFMPALAVGLTLAAVLSLLVYSPSVTLELAGRPALLAGGIVIGLFGTLIPFGLTIRSVHYITPTETAILGGLEAVVGGIVAAAWLGDLLEAAQVLGGALILASVVGLSLSERQEAASPR